MSRLFGSKRGKLALSKRQNACEEESDDQAHLTNLEPSTKERDTPEPPSTSVTDSDGDQSVLQKGRNSKLSTDSIDSGVGRNSSHNSSSKLSHECVVCHDLNERLLQMEQSILAKKESFVKEMDDLVKKMDDLVNLVRSIRLQSVNSSPLGLSITESTNNQASSSSLLLESDTGETKMEPDFKTPPDIQTTPSTQSEASFMDESEQQRKRHYSDSKMTRYRKTEIRNKLGSVVPKALSEQIDSQTIPEEDTVVVTSQGDHDTCQLAELSEQVVEPSEASSTEEELKSRVKQNLPKFIELTNWKFLLPHLVSVDLSDRATTDFLLNENRTHQDKGVQFYLNVLPSKGPGTYTRFYTCLRGEKEHSGHKSLLQIL